MLARLEGRLVLAGDSPRVGPGEARERQRLGSGLMRVQQKLECLWQLSLGRACIVQMRGAVRLVDFHALARTETTMMTTTTLF